ncbi:MAG: multidrug effflux MFS transporter [Burkholderiales bacterium]
MRKRNEVKLLAVLGFFMMNAPASTDMYLPALMIVAQELKATPGQSQLTLSYFFLGFALGQLVWGALSDRFGRRRPMALGILLYIAGSVGCALADSIGQMMVWRFAQGFGGCAMPVIAQAMARDVFGREGSARALSIMMLVMALAPALAPFIGSKVLLVASWPVIFWILAGFGAIALACIWLMPETRPAEIRNTGAQPHLAHDYLLLVRDPVYLRYAVVSAATTGAAFAYITGTSFVFIGHFGLDLGTFSLLFGLNIVGMSAMNFANAKLVPGRGYDRLLAIGVAGCAVFALMLALQQYAFPGGFVPVAILLFLFMSMRGLVGANAMAGAMGDHPERAGAASALTGCLGFGAGYLSGLLLNFLHDGSPKPMAMVMAGFCVIAIGVLGLSRRQAAKV